MDAEDGLAVASPFDCKSGDAFFYMANKRLIAEPNTGVFIDHITNAYSENDLLREGFYWWNKDLLNDGIAGFYWSAFVTPFA